MARSPFVAYIDETGDHGLEKINPTMPVFALCAAVYKIQEYLNNDQPALTDIKFKLWYHDNVVFHSRSIRRRLPPFQALKEEAKRTSFIKEINAFFEQSCVTLIAAAIDKPRHKEQYNAPENPYFLATQFVLERIYGHIKGQGGAEATTFCIFESRGEAEDAELARWFREICSGKNYWGRPLPFKATFASKQTNMVGLQVADLAAYPISRFVERPNETRPEWEVIKPKLRRSPEGEIWGWGLKVFP